MKPGVDQFCCGASFGLDHVVAMHSFELVITEVMPHFRQGGGSH